MVYGYRLSKIEKDSKEVGNNVILNRPQNAGIFEKLRYYKRINGLTIKQLAKEIACHHEQLMDWMGGKIRPSKKNLGMIDEFLYINRQAE